MGKKLTKEEITQHTVENPNDGFDHCERCNGVEVKGNMNALDPNGMSWDLICVECDNGIKEIIVEATDMRIDELFDDAHQEFKTRSGDITPEQVLTLDTIKKNLSSLLYTQIKQNLL